MTAKHTPGPWVAEEFTHKTTRLRVRTADGAATICQVTALIHKEANARLIAAAPDLFSAIINSDDAHWTPAMRAAIAKARGET